MNFCPKCRYMLYPNIVDDGTAMQKICKNCRYTEIDTEGGLIKEVIIGGGASVKNKILDDNEFIQYDPTLPHVENIKCPSESCASNTGGQKRDVIYIKYDQEAMKYLYICNVCNNRWKSR
jgi:DNA-directed RNA polymerase subunit M/transcription elongation factor TFIIS